ncbi:hypothetical protein GGD81_004053 [Rhodobium orientis]|uniref:Bacteriophage N4 adsorption protein A C-terminal domain-containing protein n=1 Tax=Rhodobium orientis TaxID=34017 RepID=A0A327JLD2_9HYPH|nr:hypothetical protein [Rhodobium orientis]MBB4304987.1 hypothetical protein [Rhodobium orientis]MBK5948805.1 hypothetical protein [Rhodobium orientis]RAI26436.1 hypothetical protein CH339_13960 [Rhodobium orientis]
MTRLAALLAGTLLLTGIAVPAFAEGPIDSGYGAVLADPTDPMINNAYAARAEARGEYRKALATYERILVHHPDNAEAISGLMRMRRRLQPSSTQVFLELGGAYQSNPRQFPSPGETDDGNAFSVIRILDERSFGSQRWRTMIEGSGEIFGDLDVLDNFALSADTGPLFDLTPTIAVRPALVGGYAFLDGGSFFGEVGASLGFEGYLQGALQSIEIRATWRDYADRWVSDDGAVIDVRGHFGYGGLIDDADAIIVKPRLRWSGVDTRPGVVIPSGFEPGRYFEAGTKLEYYYPFAEWLLAGPNVGLFQRWFDKPVTVGGADRRDTYLAPGGSVILRDLVAENVDFRFDYRYEMQDSNDPTRDFDNHAVAGRILARF